MIKTSPNSCCLTRFISLGCINGRIPYSTFSLHQLSHYSGKQALQQRRCVHNHESRERLRMLSRSQDDIYPRIISTSNHITCQQFLQRFHGLAHNETCHEVDVVLCGRICGIRTAGSKLFFVDVVQNGRKVQAVCNFRQLSTTAADQAGFRECTRQLQAGDILKLMGNPHKTSNGELSLLLRELPQIVSPCLPPLPIGLQDQQTRIRNRHVDFIVNPSMADLMKVKSAVIQQIRQFLLDDGHIEVQTPILADEAGGASARPFQTTATEFPSRKLALRISPELWLKRMVIGGFDRIFEIGPSFRNEGIDLTHNPEFTTCEFYRAFTDLEKLIEMTQRLLANLSNTLHEMKRSGTTSTVASRFHYEMPFQRLDFIPALEAAMDEALPELHRGDASTELKRLFSRLDIEVPDIPTLPHLLDRLSTLYLEPQCHQPTFIVNYPECMSPLAKSFVHPTTSQRVAARAELFINSTEIANMYEEENSPLEQRRKFTDQILYHGGIEKPSIEESYLEALEWGLPPTGGWGAGIERLCMLLTGHDRISDVLAFGTLRNVVGRRSV